MRRVTPRSQRAKADAPRRNHRTIHAYSRSSRIRIVDVSGSTYVGPGSHGMRVLARMASSSLRFSERYSSLARRRFSPRTVFDLGVGRLTTSRIRRGIADGSYGPASAAHDIRSCFNPVGRAGDAVVARYAAEGCPIRSRSIVSMAAGAAGWWCTFATCVLLACCRRGVGRMACPIGLCAGVAIGSVARGRARMLPGGRISFLVACCPALAECRRAAAMVDHPLSFSSDGAVRHPFRIPCLLRPCGLPGLPFHPKAVRPLRSCGPAVRRRVDVDVRHVRLPGASNDSDHKAPGDAEFPGIWISAIGAARRRGPAN